MPRKDLYARVDRRIEAMAAAGWVDEVRRLLKSGLKPGAPAMTGIGYREMAAYIRGEMSLEDALAAAKRSTRRLIRHQYNWFKPDDGRIRWLDASQSAASQAAVLVREWMTRQA
jgi:tRNA dimethylallyltransferase